MVGNSPSSSGSSRDASDAPVGSMGKGTAGASKGDARPEQKAASRMTIIISTRQQSKRCASKQFAANKKTGCDPRRRPIKEIKLQTGER